MAVGLPMKTTYADGDVYSASDVNDITGTVNLIGQTNNFYAGKNKIINGDFRVSQRGTSFNTASTGWNYTLDRWLAYTFSASTVTVTQQTFTPATAPVAGYEGSNFLRINSTNTRAQIGTRIEDVRTLAGQTATLSFWAKSGSAQTLTVLELSQKFGSGGSADVDTNLTLPTLTTSWARYTASVSIPSLTGKTIGTGSYLQLSIGGAINNALDIWGVQLEAGSTATAFQTATGSIQGELAACQRYYEIGYGGFVGYGTNTSQAGSQITFAVQKRVQPTMTVTSAAASGFDGVALSSDVTVYGFMTKQTCNSTGNTRYFFNSSTASAEL